MYNGIIRLLTLVGVFIVFVVGSNNNDPPPHPPHPHHPHPLRFIASMQRHLYSFHQKLVCNKIITSLFPIPPSSMHRVARYFG